MQIKYYLIKGVTVTGEVIHHNFVSKMVLFKVNTINNLEPSRQQLRKLLGRTSNPCLIPLYDIAEKS